jgi:hypothetical protein
MSNKFEKGKYLCVDFFKGITVKIIATRNYMKAFEIYIYTLYYILYIRTRHLPYARVPYMDRSAAPPDLGIVETTHGRRGQ